MYWLEAEVAQLMFDVSDISGDDDTPMVLLGTEESGKEDKAWSTLFAKYVIVE